MEREFAACPTCHQYSHSIGEDRISEAFNHFQTMYAHPVRGHPMGYIFEEKTRDMAQVLMAAISNLQKTQTAQWQI